MPYLLPWLLMCAGIVSYLFQVEWLSIQGEAAGCPQNHTGTLCAYQWYTPCTLHTWGRIEGDLPSKSSLRGWYLLGIVPIYSNCIKCLWEIVNFKDTHISLSHTVHHREIWGICKRYLGGWYTPGMGACSIRMRQFPHIRHQAPGIGGRVYHW